MALPLRNKKNFFLKKKTTFWQPLSSGGGAKALMARPLKKNFFTPYPSKDWLIILMRFLKEIITHHKK